MNSTTDDGQTISPIFVACVEGIVSISGLFGYCIFFVTIFKNRQSFLRNKFWILSFVEKY